MNLHKLYELISKPENKSLYDALLNITAEEYVTLSGALKKAKDKSRSLGKEKVLGLILAKRFGFIHHRPLIERLILPDVSNRTIIHFIRVVSKVSFEEKALSSLPTIAQKIDPKNALIQHSTIYPIIYNNLNHFINAIRTVHNNPFLKINDEWKQRYLNKPVGEKKRTGQDNFLALWPHLIFDLEDFATDLDYVSWYAALVINTYVHNSSYRPLIGYGKAQKREMDLPNLYFRSQNKHPVASLYKLLTNSNNRQCLLPRNEDTLNLTRYDNTFNLNLAKYDAHGYVMPGNQGESISYFSLPLAYSGLRSNIYQVTVLAVRTFLKDKTPAVLIGQINDNFAERVNTSHLKFSHLILQERIVSAQAIVGSLMPVVQSMAYYPNLYAKLTSYRHNNARQLQEFSEKEKFKRIKVSWDGETTCLDITFYPGYVNDSDNYTVGVTNVIINFFVALLNHYSKTAGLSIHVDRRQSFGFNRITITNTSSLCMRVSLGYEPASFNDIFLKALITLNSILDQYNFLDKTNEVLKKGFEPVEKPKNGTVTEKTGVRFLKFMRSKKRILTSINFAQYVLDQAPKEPGYEKQIFCQYIDFVTDVDAKFDKKLERLNAFNPREAHSLHKNILVIGLLQNVLKFTMKTIDQSFLIYPQIFIHSYSKTLVKLITLSKKAIALIESHINYPESHIYNKVLSLVNDMCEHLILMRALIYLMQPKVENNEALTKVKKREINSARAVLQIEPENQIDLFFTDNGQQALTASLAAMCKQVNDSNQIANHKVYLSSKCYYELESYMKSNLKIKLLSTSDYAEFIYIDIRNIKDNVPTPSAKAVIIDSTHQPLLTTPGLSQFVQDLLNRGVWVVIVSSMLKHEQLGMDKFQAGKLMLLSPPGKQLNEDIRNSLESITNNAMHPIVSVYFQMMNKICRDKYGLFARPPVAEQIIDAVQKIQPELQ